jgi:hypothetical protein
MQSGYGCNPLIRILILYKFLYSRFEQLKEFGKLFGFLYNSKKLKPLDDSNLRKNCTTFAETFTHKESDVYLDDFISKLKVLQVTLPNDFMSAI